MRIVIDLQGAQTGSRHRGIGRYSLAVTQEIIRQRGADEILVALNGLFPDTIEPIRAALDGILPQDKILVWNAFGPVDWLNPANDHTRHLAERIREAFLASLAPDMVLVTSVFEGAGEDAVTTIGKHFAMPTAAILYDLIPLMHSKIYLEVPIRNAWYHNKLTCLRKADILLAISSSSKEEAIDHLGYPREQIETISTASAEGFYPRPLAAADYEKLQSRFGIKRPYLLYVSAADERKNHVGLISAFAALAEPVRSSHQLVLAGGLLDDHRERFLVHAASMGLLPDEIIIISQLSDDELLTIYNGCKAFVFPSWHEGFGLPALEAMQCGKAVIASNLSSLPEVVGLEDALFDPHDVSSIAGKIAHVLTDDDFRVRLERHSKVQAGKFSWRDTARRALDFIRDRARLADGSRRSIPPEIASEWALSSLLIGLDGPARMAGVDRRELALMLATNFPPAGRRQQLLIDVSELIQRDANSGIQRVVKSVAQEWLSASLAGWIVEPVYGTREAEGYRYARTMKEKLFDLPEKSSNDETVEAFPGDVFVGLDLQHHVLASQVDVLSQWRRRGVTIHFVVHDLLPVTMPQFFPEGSSAMHQSWLESIARFDQAVCVSQTTAEALRRWLVSNPPSPGRPLRISWFHLGGDAEQSSRTMGLPSDAELILNTVKRSKSFLMVGTIEPRKGHAQTLAAFEKLWVGGRDLKLILVGKPGWQMDDFIERIRNHPENGSRLIWLEGVSDEYLEKIYKASTCLIFASEGEGFGLPLFEAARHGVPIIARDIPVFREVAGDHAFYFPDEGSPAAIASPVEEWMALFQRGAHPASNQVNWLTWKQSSARLLQLVLERSPTEEANRVHAGPDRTRIVEHTTK